MARQIVEHWNNGQDEAGRRTVQLQIGDDGRWQVYATSGEKWWVLAYPNQASARAELAVLMEEYGPWRRVG